jgi:hypothetical protein
MAKELEKDFVQRLARLGAQARLQQLDEERREILRAFPGLAAAVARQKPGEPAAAAPSPAAAGKAAAAKKRGRRKMTAAEKKVASERMRKYWAERKKKVAEKK